VVELGSFCGLSTMYLSVGVRASESKLVCVDTFQANAEGEDVSAMQNKEAVLKYYKMFSDVGGSGGGFVTTMLNLHGIEYLKIVEPVVGKSLEVVKEWDPERKVDLIFIDANHSHTRQDFEAWIPYLQPWGMVAFHDVNKGGLYGADGPDNTVLTALQSGKWKLWFRGFYLACITRDIDWWNIRRSTLADRHSVLSRWDPEAERLRNEHGKVGNGECPVNSSQPTADSSSSGEGC
jgi:hypothetical protein